MVIELAAALRMADGERDADHAAEAGADKRDRRRAAEAFEPRRHQIGEARHRNRRRLARDVVEARATSSRCRASTGTAPCGASDRSGRARSSAGHQASRAFAVRRLPSPSGNGDAVMPPTMTTTGAVPSSGPYAHPLSDDVAQHVALDGHRLALDREAPGRYGGPD